MWKDERPPPGVIRINMITIFPYMLIQYPSPRINMNKYVYIIPLYVNMISIEISQNMIQYKYELDKDLTLQKYVYD